MGRRPSGTPSPFSRQIVRAVVRLREKAGITNVELIKRAEFSPNYFYMRLRGDATFDTNDIERLASVFEVTPADVMTLASSLADDDDPDALIAVDRAELARRLNFLSMSLPVDAPEELLRSEGAELSGAEWAELRSGAGPLRVSHSLLTAIAGYFAVTERYLLELGSDDVAQRVEAEVDLQRALTESGADSVAARALGDVSPHALKAITEAIRSIDRGR